MILLIADFFDLKKLRSYPYTDSYYPPDFINKLDSMQLKLFHKFAKKREIHP